MQNITYQRDPFDSLSPAGNTFRFSQVRAFTTFIGFSLSTGQCRQLIDVSGGSNESDIGAREIYASTPIDTGKGNRTGERCTGSVKKWGLLRESRLSTDWRARPSACGHPRSGSYYRMVAVCTPARHFDIPIYPPVHKCRIHDYNQARTHKIDKKTLRLDYLWNSALHAF